jgi:adenylate cyclase
MVIASLTGVIVLAMGFLSWLFARRIASPLLALSRDMERIQQFELDGELVVDSRISEIQKMEHSLDNMKKGLRSFKKFVPSDLVAELIGLEQEAVLGTEKRELTVFFCDLENFTSAGEKLSSEELNLLLSTYFATITRTLQEYGATIDKFIGDAVMAFWGAPRTMSDHARQGVLAALELLRRLESLRAEWETQGLPSLKTRIGLNTGHVLVGNVGYENRLSYTALGDSVNLASRLESLNKYYETHILIGEETLRAIDRSVAWRPVDKVAVKGKTKGTLIAEISDAAPAWWNEYLRGWKAYRASDWKAALDHFDKVRSVRSGDGPSRVLGDRCRRFLERGVPADWTGVWVMHDK